MLEARATHQTGVIGAVRVRCPGGTFFICTRKSLMGFAKSAKLPSERSFGALFAAVFAGIGVYGCTKGWGPIAWIGWLAASTVVGCISLFAPKRLGPLNKAWFLLGQLLGKIVSPVVFAIIFFGLLSPAAFFLRQRGRDELRLKRRPVASFWIDRRPPGPAADSFKNQF